uniref:Uncharacterized protein n=1 Tax=Nelumbo nucifera TaxID=4432 RepID=A0A822ZKG8_NELNU|nr:TPA_asm: hypothetical protein HUJ06_002165 [Nelumbo nucifera]
MWRVWKEGGTWFLYWGAKCYEKANVASAEIRFRCGLPPGDVVLFYPGEVFSSSHQLVASVRLERILSGLQEIHLPDTGLSKESWRTRSSLTSLFSPTAAVKKLGKVLQCLVEKEM